MTNVEAVATVRGIFARGLCPMTDVTNEILDLALQKGDQENISSFHWQFTVSLIFITTF